LYINGKSATVKKKRTFLINQSADLYPTKYQKIN